MVDETGGGEVVRRLAAICGAGFARVAGVADGVAGRSARWVAAPGSVDAVSASLRLAAEHNLAVVPRGAGTKLDWGAAPSQLDIVLDTGRLAGIWQHRPDEPVAEVGAGTPLRAVRAVLEQTGRRVPLDAPSPGATLGGVLAADEAGPLRHRYGTLCDQVLGVSYVDATGGLKHAGGGAGGLPGPDLARLLCGSQGALGVLVSATLRVHSVPASRIWVSFPVWTPLQVHDLIGEVLAAPVDPAAIEVDLPAPRPGSLPRRGSGTPGDSAPAGPPETLPTGRPPGDPPRGTGHPAGTGTGHPAGTGTGHPAGTGTGHPAGTGRAARAGGAGPGPTVGPDSGPAGKQSRESAGGPSGDATGGPRGGSTPGASRGAAPPGPGSGRLTVLLEGGPADVAERVTRLMRLLGGDPEVAPVPPPWWGRYPFRPDDVALRLTVPAGDLHAAIYVLRDAAGAPVPVRGSAGLGVVHAALPGGTAPERVSAILTAVRTVLLARGGRCEVLAAPGEIRRVVDIWGDRPDLPRLRRVKERFDPARRLAPGRFTGGI